MDEEKQNINCGGVNAFRLGLCKQTRGRNEEEEDGREEAQ